MAAMTDENKVYDESYTFDEGEPACTISHSEG